MLPVRLGVSAPTVYTTCSPNSLLSRMAPYSLSSAANQNTGMDRNRNPRNVKA
jgi:hypothetical protein